MIDPADVATSLADARYLPGLGLIHPDEDPLQCWRDLLAINGTGAFLPYDKDRAWGGRKTARVLTDAISTADNAVFIPVWHKRGRDQLEVCCYGDLGTGLDAGAEVAAKLAAEHGIAAARLKWHSIEPDEAADHVVRIQLKTFTPDPPATGRQVLLLAEQPPKVRNTFASFAEAAGEGFPFLTKELRNGLSYGPILTISDSEQIVGAIGPMRLQADSQDRPRLMGQYFAVLPTHRRRGLGRNLWRAAMHWGQTHGAAYQLLQTEYGGPSDRLCRSEGLISLGYINSRNVPR